MNRTVIRLLAGFVAFMAVWLFGDLVLGIHPTLAEALLVVCAVGASSFTEALFDRLRAARA